jgi:diacylglycerol kinase (CTP)
VEAMPLAPGALARKPENAAFLAKGAEAEDSDTSMTTRSSISHDTASITDDSDNETEISGKALLNSAVNTSIPSHRKYSSLVHDHELPRKFLHVSIGFLTLWLYTRGVSLQQVSPVLAAMFFGIATTDVIRFRNPSFNRYYIEVVGFMMREREVSDRFNGVIWYLLGIIVVFEIFPKDISVLAVLLLSWADTAASTIGRAYGYLTPKFGNKSLAGSAAAFVVSAFSVYVLYGIFIPSWHSVNKHGDILWQPQTSYVSLPVLMFVAGLAGSVSEAIDIIDDNFSIPVVSATLVWLFVTYTNKPLQIM